MTTFSTQRELPEVARAEARLLDILSLLGRARIPDLEVGEFYEDLEKSPGTGAGLEGWEEQVGVRLGLRILDQVIFDHFAKQEELSQTVAEMKSTKQKLEKENSKLKAEIEALKHSSETKLKEKDTETSAEISKLQESNKEMKNKLVKLMKQFDVLSSEITRDPVSSPVPSSSSSRPSSVSLPVPTSSSKSLERSSKLSRPMRGENIGEVTSVDQSVLSSGARKRKTPSPTPTDVKAKGDVPHPVLGSTPKVQGQYFALKRKDKKSSIGVLSGSQKSFCWNFSFFSSALFFFCISSKILSLTPGGAVLQSRVLPQALP